MPSSGYTCVNTSDIERLGKAAAAYKKISDEQVIVRAATTAGEHLKEAMQKTIRGESTLRSYGDVSEALVSWSDSQNVYVGLPESSPLLERAEAMDAVYPVTEVVSDLTRQQGDTEEAFYDALAEIVSR